MIFAYLFAGYPGHVPGWVLCFDYRKSRDTINLTELHSSKGHKYIWYALPGYAIGLITALAAGVLTHSPQPALLYLILSKVKTSGADPLLGPLSSDSWIQTFSGWCLWCSLEFVFSVPVSVE
ncbi:signal peptide peptidase-like 1 [Trifolium pratense]|nr:signal peptide peptidase-like 1 [Trifolium pratense]